MAACDNHANGPQPPGRGPFYQEITGFAACFVQMLGTPSGTAI